MRYKFIDPDFGFTQAERVLQVLKSIKSCDAWMGMAFGCNDLFHLEQNLESLEKSNLSEGQVFEYFNVEKLRRSKALKETISK